MRLLLIALIVMAAAVAPAPARAACAPLALLSYTRGTEGVAAAPPAVCVELGVPGPNGPYDRLTIIWQSGVTEAQVLWLTEDKRIAAQTYFAPVGNPEALGYRTHASVRQLAVSEWRERGLIGHSVYAWPAYRVALPLLAR